MKDGKQAGIILGTQSESVETDDLTPFLVAHA